MMTFEESIDSIDYTIQSYQSEIAMLRDNLSRLRASHAELLAAAKMVNELLYAVFEAEHIRARNHETELEQLYADLDRLRASHAELLAAASIAQPYMSLFM